MFAIFLTSGLFLGWSLGANDAANVFGTAVGTRMISFKKAATFCGIFVILGAVISGAGAAKTLGELGAVNAIAGAFVVALAAAVTVYWLTVLGYPVSTTQAIVGAIVGWDLFSGALIDYGSLEKIVLSWIISPILAAVFSAHGCVVRLNDGYHMKHLVAFISADGDGFFDHAALATHIHLHLKLDVFSRLNRFGQIGQIRRRATAGSGRAVNGDWRGGNVRKKESEPGQHRPGFNRDFVGGFVPGENSVRQKRRC